MHNIIFTIFLLILIPFQSEKTQKEMNVRIDRWGITNSKFYEVELINKKELEIFLENNTLNSFPDEIRVFKFKLERNLKTALKKCEEEILLLSEEYKNFCVENGHEFTGEGFGKFWRKRLKACYLKYKELAPQFCFTFYNPNKLNYYISSIQVNIYSGTKSQGNVYVNDKEMGNEFIILHSEVGEKEYNLKRIHKLDKDFFILELRFLTEDHWIGSLSKETYIIDISFILRKGDKQLILKSEPFIVDI